MFRGANSITLDTKGRVTIPTKYRGILLDDCQGQLFCTLDPWQRCLALYPLTEWEDVEMRLSRLSDTDEHERRLKRLMLGYADEGVMDKSGRFLVSPVLREQIGLDRNVMLVGQRNRFEIWDTRVWNQQIEEDIRIQREGKYELTDRLREFSL
jgi:MraZ protein